MFSFFKTDPTKKLNKLYDIKLAQAMHAQRNGDIKSYGELTVEANNLYQQILAIEAKKSQKN
jgi:hypothetical protein